METSIFKRFYKQIWVLDFNAAGGPFQNLLPNHLGHTHSDDATERRRYADNKQTTSRSSTIGIASLRLVRTIRPYCSLWKQPSNTSTWALSPPRVSLEISRSDYFRMLARKKNTSVRSKSPDPSIEPQLLPEQQTNERYVSMLSPYHEERCHSDMLANVLLTVFLM